MSLGGGGGEKGDYVTLIVDLATSLTSIVLVLLHISKGCNFAGMDCF
jgi:hypothetical protein